jgi:hypothetical protein
MEEGGNSFKRIKDLSSNDIRQIRIRVNLIIKGRIKIILFDLCNHIGKGKSKWKKRTEEMCIMRMLSARK